MEDDGVVVGMDGGFHGCPVLTFMVTPWAGDRLAARILVPLTGSVAVPRDR